MCKTAHTFALKHLPIDLDEDVGVAETHDKQRENIECHEMEHVVDCLLPAVLEASMRHTLSEVYSLSFDSPEDEQLDMEKKEGTGSLRC